MVVFECCRARMLSCSNDVVLEFCRVRIMSCSDAVVPEYCRTFKCRTSKFLKHHRPTMPKFHPWFKFIPIMHSALSLLYKAVVLFNSVL